MKAKMYGSPPPPPPPPAPPREPVLQWSYLWAHLEESGWRKIKINDVTDPVYAAMKFYAEIYVNETAKDIWTLNSFFHCVLTSGEHYFERCVVLVLAVCVDSM